MSGFFRFVSKPIFRNSVLTAFTIAIGYLCSIAAADNKNLLPLIIVSAIYILVVIVFGIVESKMSKMLQVFETQNEAFCVALSSLIKLLKESATGINAIAHDIVEKSQIDLTVWSFDKSCQACCDMIYEVIKKVALAGNDFEVCYTKLVEQPSSSKDIMTVGFANKTTSKPSILYKQRNVEGDKCYYDGKLFNEANADIVVTLNWEETSDLFEFKNRERDKKKYLQYVGIPVFCDNKKMIGLIQIVAKNKSIIADNKEEMTEMASKYLVPFGHLIVLLNKAQKGLVAGPAGSTPVAILESRV